MCRVFESRQGHHTLFTPAALRDAERLDGGVEALPEGIELLGGHADEKKRKTEVLQGKKLPETLRQTHASFAEIARDSLEYSLASKVPEAYRIDRQQQCGGPRHVTRNSSRIASWASEEISTNCTPIPTPGRTKRTAPRALTS